MSQTNYTPISLYYSTTAAAAPTAGNLVSGELAINITDGKLFYKDNAGVVQTLATKATALSTVTNNGVVYVNSSGQSTSGSALTFDGTNLGVTGTNVALRVFDTPNGNYAVFGTIGGNTVVGATGGYAIRFDITGSEQMRLTSTGLGIGTSSPAQKLDVVGNATASGYVNSNTRLRVTGGGNAVHWLSSVSDLVGSGSTTDAAFGAYGSFNWYPNNGTTLAMKLDSSGNLGLGVTPSAWVSGDTVLQIKAGSGSGALWGRSNSLRVVANTYFDGTNYKYIAADYASFMNVNQGGVGGFNWNIAPSGTAGANATFTQAMTLDASGSLLVGTTTKAGNASTFYSATAGQQPVSMWNGATAGNNYFFEFGTEGTYTARGSITYNRGAGLVAYNVTSDYRAKDIIGPVTDSGALIDSTPVYMGKMKGATQERPMFIAHETPTYAHTGEKDAVDADGNPVYQQMDASALVPVMWAEIQSLRKRLAALEAA